MAEEIQGMDSDCNAAGCTNEKAHTVGLLGMTVELCEDCAKSETEKPSEAEIIGNA